MANETARGQEAIGAYVLLRGGPPVISEPDKVLPSDGNTVRWFHRNNKSCYPITLKNQHLGYLLKKYPDPLINRTFGGLMCAEG